MKNIIEIPEGHTIEKISENSYRIVKTELKYPMRLEDACKVRLVQMVETPSQQMLYDKYHTFIKLVETCKEWNRIDGFEADWKNTHEKYCVQNTEGSVSTILQYYISAPLHFKDRETAELFLETFREEIELVKDLI